MTLSFLRDRAARSKYAALSRVISVTSFPNRKRTLNCNLRAALRSPITVFFVSVIRLLICPAAEHVNSLCILFYYTWVTQQKELAC